MHILLLIAAEALLDQVRKVFGGFGDGGHLRRNNRTKHRRR